MTQLQQQLRVFRFMPRGRILFAAVAAVFAVVLSASAFAAAMDVPPRQLLAAGRADDAIQALNSTIQNSPDNAEAYNLLARVYYALEKWDQAISAAERSVKAAPNNSDYHLWLGRAYGMKAQRSSWITALKFARKTRDEFEKAVQLDGSNVQAHAALADFYIDAPGFLGGGADKARREAEQLSAVDRAAARNIKAQLAEKDKDYKQAEAEYKAALAESGNTGSQWLELAGFYRRTSHFPEMEHAVRQAVNAEKKRGNVLYEAARQLVRSGRNYADAAQLLRKYLASPELSEEVPAFQARYLLGQALEKQGDKAGAATEYRAALATARDYQVAQNALKRVAE
jgi:Tfp pilus assembly protein PilF